MSIKRRESFTWFEPVRKLQHLKHKFRSHSLDDEDYTTEGAVHCFTPAGHIDDALHGKGIVRAMSE